MLSVIYSVSVARSGRSASAPAINLRSEKTRKEQGGSRGA